MSEPVILSVSDFVAVFNQTISYAYPTVTVVGELANFRVSKNRWVYFDLKDELASVRFFGTVYQLPGPLEDGMMLQVSGAPRLHQLYGFSINVQHMQPVGEGSIKKAAALLQAKLESEGLFDPSRKRSLPYPPQRIGLIASSESAAYVDFLKIINARWGGLEIELIDVQVQGEAAVAQVVSAIEYFNRRAVQAEVLVITRGGGSPEDLAAFSTEQVTRAVAASRIPTLVAVGHEIDVSLAELAADRRASTPSNAAELLVPDRRHVVEQLARRQDQLRQTMQRLLDTARERQAIIRTTLHERIRQRLREEAAMLESRRRLLIALSPEATLERGYAIIYKAGKPVTGISQLGGGDDIRLSFADGQARATVTDIERGPRSERIRRGDYKGQTKE